MEHKTFLLNLDVAVIKGWEEIKLSDGSKVRAVSDKVIDHMMKEIEKGTSFPPVVLTKDPFFDPDVLSFRISYAYDRENDIHYGGHNRVISHYLARKPLLFRYQDMFSDMPRVPLSKEIDPFVPISEYQIVDDSVLASVGRGIEARYEHWKNYGVYVNSQS